MYSSTGDLMAGLIKALPYPDQIINIDLNTHPDAIRFDWRGVSFKASIDGEVYETRDCGLAGSNIAMLVRELLKRVRYAD